MIHKNDFIQWKWDITDVSETGKNKGNLEFHSILVRLFVFFGDPTKKLTNHAGGLA